jgi:hypothetical protein
MHYRGIYTSFILLTIGIMAFNGTIMAKTKSSILSCLGREELAMHKTKQIGPNYRLNQLFVNELAGLGDMTIKPNYLEKICNKPQISPSVDLLRNLLIYGRNIFDQKFRHIESVHIKAYKRALTKELENRAPHIFFDYLSSLQSTASTPHCIKKYIPEISFFLERYRYLEEDLPSSQLMEDKGRIRRIFKKLKRINKIFKKCAAEKAKLDNG